MTDTNCPFCKKPLMEIFSSTSCVNSSCVFGHKMMTQIEWEEIHAALAAARADGYEQARAECQACVIPDGNPEVAKERIAALVYRPAAEAGPR